MSRYKMPFNQYKECQKMTKNEFSRWLGTFFDTAYESGYQAACKDVPEGSIVIDPSDNVVVEWIYEEFKEMLLSVKGIDEAKAESIIDRLYEYYEAKNKQKYEEA